MAYTDGDLTILSLGPTRTVWHYSTNDTLAVVAGSGYFNTAWPKFKAYDVIMVSSDLDGTPLPGRFSVSAVATSSVTLTGWSADAAQAAAPAGGTGATAGAYDTANNRNACIALVNAMRDCLIAHGLMKGAA